MSAFAPQFVLNDMFAAAFNDALQQFASNIVSKCADSYGFDKDHALRALNIHNISTSFVSSNTVKITKKTTKNNSKSAFPLPFSGTRDHSLCDALKLNKGLYTQCSDKPLDGQHFCSSCFQQVQANPNALPNYGTIHQRLEQPLYDFKDPSGNSPVPYSKIITKLNLSKQQVIDEAAKFGLSIPDEHFDFAPAPKRGRPASKSTDDNNPDKDNNDDTPKKKGRPRKAPIVVQAAHDPTDDLFANLVSLAQNKHNDYTHINYDNNESLNNESHNNTQNIHNDNNDSHNDSHNDESHNNDSHNDSHIDNDNDFDNLAIALIEAVENNISTTPADNIQSNIINNISSKPSKIDKELAKKEKEAAKLAAKEQAKKDKDAAKLAAKKDKPAAKTSAKNSAKKDSVSKDNITASAPDTPTQVNNKPDNAKNTDNAKKPDNNKKPDNHDDTPTDTVQRISFNGIKYLRSTASHIVYNLDEEPLGVWNFHTNSIDFYDHEELDNEDFSDQE